MNKDVKQKWLAALRSGKYKQGALRLRASDSYCCLGVLCDIAVKEGVIPEPTAHTNWRGEIYSYDYGDDEHGYINTTLPHSVSEWAGLTEENPVVSTALLKGIKVEGDYDEYVPFDQSESLAEINDSGLVDFKKIADIIEAEL